MQHVRITGIVRQANYFRRVLSSPITAAQRDALSDRLQHSICQIEALLQRYGGNPTKLPAQSRRAYAYLKSLDLPRVPVAEGPAAGSFGTESVSFRGLRPFLDSVLDDIAANTHAGRLNADAMHDVIRRTRDRLDRAISRDGLHAEHLRPQSRELVGWFRYFGEPGCFSTYLDAVRRAQSTFAEPVTRARWRLPLLVHFRPSRNLYKWQPTQAGTRVILSTPGVTFEDGVLVALANQMCGGPACQATIMDAMLADEYQAVRVELEAAGGIVQWTRGVVHDLTAVFETVNRAYFAGALARPHLTWNRTMTGRKFGHYDFVRDTVMISSSLDQPQVPAFVVEHVMHHELLHKKHGFRWTGGRRRAHTPEFRIDERAFPRYTDADDFLKKLARRA